jgi:hypothetical protein
MDDKLMKLLAVKFTGLEISILTLKHLLEQQWPGFLDRHERGFELLWDQYKSASIRKEYQSLRCPDRSLDAMWLQYATDDSVPPNA